MIKINFSDQYTGFTPEKSSLFRFLQDRFGVILSDHPDYLIVGPYGFEHLKYKSECIKIFWTGESVIPDFNLFDYAIGFDHLSLGDRYLRVPLYPFREMFVGFREIRPTDEELLNRDFCSFVVSNGNGDPIRTEFFERLSKYKRVNSGGRYLNNIGGPVADKKDFVAKHKFSITFENASSPGYVTEKIMEAHAAWSVPIYWGDPLVKSDFREESFVWVKDRQSIDSAIEHVIELDRNDAVYLEMCTAEPLVHVDCNYYWNELEQFFAHIFGQSMRSARRLMDYGCQAVTYRPAIVRAFEDSRLMEKPRYWKRKIDHYRARIAEKLMLRAI